MRLRVPRKAFLCDFKIVVWKWVWTNFTYFLVTEKFVRWILVLRSSQVCAGKNFWDKNLSWAYFSIRRRELVQKKATQKVNSLAQISCSRIFEQRKRIIDSFINSLFLYCAPIFMFLSGCLNNLINLIHERTSRISYQDYNSLFT